MHVVLGDGEMSRKELTETLKDLWNRAGDEPFWFLVQGKPEPTETDANLLTWLNKNEIYYEVVTDDEDSLADIYGQRQQTHTAKRLAQKIVNMLSSAPEDGESADVLGLFTSDDPGAEEDRWLNSVIQSAIDAGYPALALNDGLVEIDLSGGEEEAEAEEEPVATKTGPSKRTAKKVAAPSGNGTKSEADYTREQLEELELPELKDIAAAKGIELAPRTRMATYIDAILGEGKPEAPAVEVTPVPPAASGDVDLELVAKMAAEILIERIVAALQKI